MAARRIRTRGIRFFLIALALCSSSLAAPAPPFAAPKPVTLTVLAPISPSEFPILIGRFLNTPTETSGGWPITIQLSFDNNQLLGIATEYTPPVFPLTGVRGYVVFNLGANPCRSFLPIEYENEDHPCTQVDETYVEFTPNVLLPGVSNAKGNPDQLFHLTDTGGGGQPHIQTGDPVTLVSYGPGTGGADSPINLCLPESYVFPIDLSLATVCSDPGVSVCPDYPRSRTCRTVASVLDGYGYGASASLPGLVIVADAGPGVMLGQDPTVNQSGDYFLRDAQGHRQARNLGGFLSAVSYELNNSLKMTSVLAHMNVPDGLFDPVIVLDPCVGAPFDPGDPANEIPPSGCEQPAEYRVDGGPVTTTTPDPNRLITVRMFVVNRTAPDTLADGNNDGVVDSKDAVLAGYTLLSNEVKVQFKILNQNEFPYLFVDLDGNHSFPPIAAPAGGGTVTKPPR
jgi:hypothetical protein